MREIGNEVKLKYLCSAFSTTLSLGEINKETGLYAVYGASGLMGYIDVYKTDKEYLGIVKDGAGVGRINKYPAQTSLLGTMTTIIPNEDIDIDWLKFAITSMDLGNSIDKTTIPHIYFSIYGNNKVRNLSELEQKKISSCLNEKSTQIDTLIVNQEAQIEKLKQYKQSLITEVVTKGLNLNAKMKDSGIEWIGVVNSNFNVQPINALFSIEKRILGKEPEQVLSITQRGIVPKDITNNEGQMANSYAHYQIVHKGDFAMNHMDLLTGGVGISEYEGVTSPDYRVFVLKNKEMNARYFLYVFETYYRNKIFYAFGQGAANVGRWRLPAQNFKTIYIPVPNVKDQNEIVEYLDVQCAKIDKLIEIKQSKIAKLNDYKKSLIYEYVTGKKEV